MTSKIIKRKLTARTRSFYSLSEVCTKMGFKHVLVAERLGLGNVDCMTSKIKITDFCIKIGKNKEKLTRGVVDSVTGDAVCEYADNVMLILKCDKRDKAICLRKKQGCQSLGKIFAVGHELVHHSILDDNLHCYFSFSEQKTNGNYIHLD